MGTLTTRLLSATIGRVVPRFRTCNEWADDYRQIIDHLPVCEHTKVNRRCALVHVLAHLGNDVIGSVRPLRVGKAIRDIAARFEEAREGAGLAWDTGTPPSLHECRSLSERLYREQGIDTRVLLGHKHQSMTDVYNDDRGLTGGKWITLKIGA